VSQDVWSARDTTPDAIEAALRELVHKSHAREAGLVPARVLNLVVVVDRELRGEVKSRLERVGRNHASRTILCAVGNGNGGLDARAVIASDGSAGGIGVIREEVELDLSASQLASLNTIVDPVLASELPTVLWCPHGHAEAVDAMIGLADVIMLDSDEDPEPPAALGRSAELAASVHVVDLAWLRTVPWRERLAATFDPPYRRCELPLISAVEIRHRSVSTASALLLAGWLAARLGWEPGRLDGSDGGPYAGSAVRGKQQISIDLHPTHQDAPGLAGVTVASADGFAVSLDRGRGGLLAHRRRADGTESSWQVLGASRGEGGILGEGVRQALMRDPIYPDALDAARAFCLGPA
jgi:glucose-6-phosphate dehydrogenase assembly protein OpcA